jgi:hypothetical protein
MGSISQRAKKRGTRGKLGGGERRTNMALHALKIVKEEFARALPSYDDDGRGHVSQSSVTSKLVKLEARILERIVEECIEQPDPGPRPGQECWAVGVEESPGEFGMYGGPWPTFEQAITQSVGRENSCIIHWPPSEPGEEVLCEITHRWKNNRWVEES